MSKEKLPTAIELMKNDGLTNNDALSLELTAYYMGRFADLNTSDIQNQLEEKDREIERLKKEVVTVHNKWAKIYAEHKNGCDVSLNKVCLENTDLREALEKILNEAMTFDTVLKIAKEALKQQQDDSKR